MDVAQGEMNIQPIIELFFNIDLLMSVAYEVSLFCFLVLAIYGFFYDSKTWKRRIGYFFLIIFSSLLVAFLIFVALPEMIGENLRGYILLHLLLVCSVLLGIFISLAKEAFNNSRKEPSSFWKELKNELKWHKITEIIPFASYRVFFFRILIPMAIISVLMGLFFLYIIGYILVYGLSIIFDIPIYLSLIIVIILLFGYVLIKSLE